MGTDPWGAEYWTLVGGLHIEQVLEEVMDPNLCSSAWILTQRCPLTPDEPLGASTTLVEPVVVIITPAKQLGPHESNGMRG